MADWSKDQVEALLDKITKSVPNNDTLKFSTLADKLDWDEIKVGGHSADRCKEKWTELATNVSYLILKLKPLSCHIFTVLLCDKMT